MNENINYTKISEEKMSVKYDFFYESSSGVALNAELGTIEKESFRDYRVFEKFPRLNFDIGDFNLLKKYFPFEPKEGFNVDIMNLNF